MLSAHLPCQWEQYDAADGGVASGVITDEFGKLPRACEIQGHQEIWHAVIVAARALLTPREQAMPGRSDANRRDVKHFEARPMVEIADEKDPKLAIAPAETSRTVMAEMTLHVNGDNTVWVLLHLQWRSNKMTYHAIRDHEVVRPRACYPHAAEKARAFRPR